MSKGFTNVEESTFSPYNSERQIAYTYMLLRTSEDNTFLLPGEFGRGNALAFCPLRQELHPCLFWRDDDDFGISKRARNSCLRICRASRMLYFVCGIFTALQDYIMSYRRAVNSAEEW
jgi:hypothetical protein